jgi:hypothetical protein
MLEGVGRRLGAGKDHLLDIAHHSLNGRERNVLWRNDGDRFTDVAYVNAADRIEDGRGLAVLDVDRDGRLDLLLRNYRSPAVLLRNRGDPRHWVGFELVGKRSNRDAVGARVRVRAGELWQTRVVEAGSGYLSAGSRRLHFGLGQASRVDEVEISWPSGLRTRLPALEAGRSYRITEELELAGASEAGASLLGRDVERAQSDAEVDALPHSR